MPERLPSVPKGFSPFLELVGVTFTRVEDGRSQAFLKIEERLLNSMRIVHGGAAFTLVDCGMGAALYSCLEENEVCRTVETKIAYFRPVSSGVLTCNSKVVHRSRRIATLESEIEHGGQLVAKAIGTFSIHRRGEKE